MDANRALGLPDDCREYSSVRNILADLGIRSIRLMVGPAPEHAPPMLAPHTLRQRAFTMCASWHQLVSWQLQVFWHPCISYDAGRKKGSSCLLI